VAALRFLEQLADRCDLLISQHSLRVPYRSDVFVNQIEDHVEGVLLEENLRIVRVHDCVCNHVLVRLDVLDGVLEAVGVRVELLYRAFPSQVQRIQILH